MKVYLLNFTRYAIVPPHSGLFALGCVATIFDIYARKSEPAYIREDAPHSASVTGEDSSGKKTKLKIFIVYDALYTYIK